MIALRNGREEKGPSSSFLDFDLPNEKPKREREEAGSEPVEELVLLLG